MSGITAAQMTQMQTDGAALVCDLACTIKRRGTRTSTAQGGNSATYSTIATTTAGMNQPSAAQLTNYGYAIGSKGVWSIRFPASTDVQKGDHLIIQGQTLEVIVALTPQSYSVFTNVLASEVK